MATTTAAERPFVLVLIDGDSYLFKESTTDRTCSVKHRLLVELERYMNALNGVKNCNEPGWRCWPQEDFVVRVYLNFRDLKRKVQQYQPDAILADLDDLMKDFRSPKMQWDIIDVGPGSENADVRIARDWATNIHEPCLVHCILGLCHDSGYVDRLQLRNIAGYSKYSRKVSLVTCTATHRLYRSLCFPIVAWPSLFHDEPINGRPSYTEAAVQGYRGTYPQHKSDLALMLKAEKQAKEHTRLAALESTEREGRYKARIQELERLLISKDEVSRRAYRIRKELEKQKDMLDDPRLDTNGRGFLDGYNFSTAFMPYVVTINFVTGVRWSMRARADTTIKDIQASIEQTYAMPPRCQRLLYNGVRLCPSSTVEMISIGPRVNLVMAQLDRYKLDLLELDNGERNEWVRVLNGGWAEGLDEDLNADAIYANDILREIEGPFLPALRWAETAYSASHCRQ